MNSSDDLIILILVVGMAALIAAIRLVVVTIRRRAWKAAAERTGMAFSPGNFFGRGLSVSGVYQSYPLSMDAFNFRSGRSSSTYTRIILPLELRSELSLWIFTQGLFTKFAKSLGMNDIQTGDDALDRRYLVRGKPESEVIRLLSSINLRQKLMKAPSLQIRVEDGQINLQKQGVVANTETLVGLLDLAVTLASAVESIQ